MVKYYNEALSLLFPHHRSMPATNPSATIANIIATPVFEPPTCSTSTELAAPVELSTGTLVAGSLPGPMYPWIGARNSSSECESPQNLAYKIQLPLCFANSSSAPAKFGPLLHKSPSTYYQTAWAQRRYSRRKDPRKRMDCDIWRE
jgi:hypothetical protein